VKRLPANASRSTYTIQSFECRLISQPDRWKRYPKTFPARNVYNNHLSLSIVYKDVDIVAVYKPAGMVVHRCEATPADEVALLQLLRDQLQQHVYPVHRLDQPTSGIVLFGLNSQAAAALVDQFTHRRIHKCYQAVVVGHSPRSGIINIPLTASEGPAGTDASTLTHSAPVRQAKTTYHTLAHFEPSWPNVGPDQWQFSLIEATPHTGRWHQIRRHLTSIDHPILGDRRHGNPRYNDTIVSLDPTNQNDRMMLHASYVQFRHPTTGELTELRCDPDSSYLSIVNLLGNTVTRYGISGS
jgi:tRNA pseudouridine65 synthase